MKAGIISALGEVVYGTNSGARSTEFASPAQIKCLPQHFSTEIDKDLRETIVRKRGGTDIFRLHQTPAGECRRWDRSGQPCQPRPDAGHFSEARAPPLRPVCG